jgi:hypothetical protein
VANFFGPVITSLSPATGPVAGGSPVTITGTDFVDVTAVLFGSTPAASFTVESFTTITAIAPPGTGTVDVFVTASSLTSPITVAGQYTYQGLSIPHRPRHFRGVSRVDKKKLYVKTWWKKSSSSNIIRYEIFARDKRIEKISSRKGMKATIRLHRHHHRTRPLSKSYRDYLHRKYAIRAVDSTGAVSALSPLTVRP